jgi:hypothetical protein
MASPSVEDLDASCPVGSEGAEGPLALWILVIEGDQGPVLPPEVMEFATALQRHFDRE